MCWQVKLGDAYWHGKQCHLDRDLRFYARFQGSRVKCENWLERVAHVLETLSWAYSRHLVGVQSMMNWR